MNTDNSLMWLKAVTMLTHFLSIKVTHLLNPEPNIINSALKNALVEVHFNIHHYHIDDFNSLTAVPLQLIILKDGSQLPSSPYKWKNICEGPMWPKLFDGPPSITLSASSPKPVPTLSLDIKDKQKQNMEMEIVIEEAAELKYFVFLILLVQFCMPACTNSLF